jgi:calcineurin-like phosphoesterase family protein
MKMFITSNQQFGRQNAIDEIGRKFNSIESMNEYMIKQWNSVVSEGDVVYVVGHFAWDPETAEDVIKQLNGKIILLPGKWDQATIELAEKFGDELNLSVINDSITFLKSLNICVSYWPLADWYNKEWGSINVVGLYKEEFKTNHKEGRINVAADYWDFKPVDVQQVMTLFKDPDLRKKG